MPRIILRVDLDAFYPVIVGADPKTQETLRHLHVKTIGQLAALPQETLIRHFGRTGTWLWQAAHGIDDSDVIEAWRPKSLSSEHTFEIDEPDRRRYCTLSWISLKRYIAAH